MLQKKLWLYGFVVFGLFFTMVPKSSAQSVFRIGAWCLRGDGAQPDPVYTNSQGQLSIKGPERNKLLNLGLNCFLGCVNLNGEDAMVFMGDSLYNAPVRIEFKTNLGIVPGSSQPPISNYWPLTMPNREIKRKAWTAFLYNDAQHSQLWQDSVVYGYQSIHSRHSSKINGVLSFFVAEEGCINTASHIAGINFMAQNAVVDGMAELGYIRSVTPPTYCDGVTTNSATTYTMANGLNQVDHIMSGGYYLSTTTPSSGVVFQDSLNTFAGSLYAAARGIRDRINSPVNTILWSIVQTQDSPVGVFNLRMPTKAEILCQVNLSLAAGAKAITYYPYSTFTDPARAESGLLNESRATTTQYDNVKDINTNYQGTGQSLTNIGGKFLNLAWKEGVTVHQNTNEPINSTYKIYDVSAKLPGGADDAENQTYVEVGVLQNASTVNHYMVVNRRCLTSETREVTITFQSTAGNAYRITDVVSGDSTTYFLAGSTFAHTLTLGPGQGKLLKFANLGPKSTTITANTTWRGTYVVNSMVTVSNGATLTIDPATTVKFFSNAGLTINGKLVANSTDPAKRITFTGVAGTWSGITIYAGTSANASTLRRCDILNAAIGMTIEYNGSNPQVTIEKCNIRDGSLWAIDMFGNGPGVTDNVTIKDNVISNNGNGIQLANYAKPMITGNRIENNFYHGIEALDNNSATVAYNLINGNSGLAASFAYSSLANFHRNTVEYNELGGVYAFSGSNLLAYSGADTAKGRNLIRFNIGAGIYAYASTPFFGKDTTGQYGRNWIYSNTGYEAQHNGSGKLWAERCYWSGEHGDISGNVDNLPYGTTQPNPVGWGRSSGYDPTYLIASPPPDIAATKFDGVQLAMAGFKNIMNASLADISDKDLQAVIETGLATGDWYAANELVTELYRELQDGRTPSVDFTLIAAYAGNEKVEAFLRKMLALVLIEKDLIESNSTAALDKLADFSKNQKEQAVEFLARAGLIHLYQRDDLAVAQAILSQLTQSGESKPAEAEHAKLFGRILQNYKRHRDKVSSNLAKSRPATAIKFAETEAPVVAQNYPNPFNPATTIRFRLHERQKVRLMVFDLHGKLVKTLADEEFASGEQAITWDSRDQQGQTVASGVYFYELAAGNKIERKKMTLVR